MNRPSTTIAVPPMPAVSEPMQLERTALERAVDRVLQRAFIPPSRDQLFPGGGFLPGRVLVADLMRLCMVRMGQQFDERHHAPCCPANHFHYQRLPSGPCTCRGQR